MSELRRWTLQEGVDFDGEWHIVGPVPDAGESVEVMPVSEHEEIVAASKGAAWRVFCVALSLASPHDLGAIRRRCGS